MLEEEIVGRGGRIIPSQPDLITHKPGLLVFSASCPSRRELLRLFQKAISHDLLLD